MRKAIFYWLLMLLVFFVAILIEVWLVPSAWGAKPMKYRTEYGSAVLTDTEGYYIWSDNGVAYTDKSKGGEDEVWFEVYENGKLKSAVIYMGKPEIPYNSSRKVNFQFDVESGIKTSEYANNQSVYEILRYTRDSFDNSFYFGRGNPAGVLNDMSVHARLTLSETSAGYSGRLQFVVDPGYDATLPQGINQSAVGALATQKGFTSGVYWDTTPEGYGHIIYTFYYNSGFDVSGVYPTWTITPKQEPVNLGVGRYTTNTSKKASHKIVYLSAYYTLPFEINLSGGSNPAPARSKNVSTVWGKMKGEL